jgi:hypothetical protein
MLRNLLRSVTWQSSATGFNLIVVYAHMRQPKISPNKILKLVSHVIEKAMCLGYKD